MIICCYLQTPMCVCVACGSITPFTSHLSPGRKRLLRCAHELDPGKKVCRCVCFLVKLPANLYGSGASRGS